MFALLRGSLVAVLLCCTLAHAAQRAPGPLVTSADGAATSSEIVLVQNWFTELRRLVPTP